MPNCDKFFWSVKSIYYSLFNSLSNPHTPKQCRTIGIDKRWININFVMGVGRGRWGQRPLIGKKVKCHKTIGHAGLNNNWHNLSVLINPVTRLSPLQWSKCSVKVTCFVSLDLIRSAVVLRENWYSTATLCISVLILGSSGRRRQRRWFSVD